MTVVNEEAGQPSGNMRERERQGGKGRNWEMTKCTFSTPPFVGVSAAGLCRYADTRQHSPPADLVGMSTQFASAKWR